MDESEQLRRAIAALEAQRGALGDDVVNAALAPMRDRLASLQAQTADEQRKLVTVLFSDLAGFTAMSERMDPEDVREVVNAYFKCWTTAIDEFGGELEKFIGDAVMAVFGLSVAHEDDPERAIRAALAMRPLLDALNEQLQAERGIQLTMRVGIHTGPVVVSMLDERRGADFVVVGDSVNLASRLQAAAPVGAIMISHDTYRHVRGLFEVQALPPIQVKGKQEPIRVYLVERAKPKAFRPPTRGVEGVQTRMFGRDAELRRLQQALEATVEDGERQFITVLGDAGIGKSRLLYEFDGWLQMLPEPVRLFRARAEPSMLYTAYSLLHSFFAFHFEIQDSDDAAVVRRKLEESVRAAFDAAPLEMLDLDSQESVRATHFVGHLAGFDFGPSSYLDEAAGNLQAFLAQALRYLQIFLRALLAESPAVILLEDLHWADDSSLDVLSSLVEELHDRPLLVVASARPGFLIRRPHWGEGQPFHSRLQLERLSSRDSRALVQEILYKVRQLPSALQALIIEQAEGNPFFVEELIKMLVEDGVIVKGPQHWDVDEERLADLRVPPTLTGVLQARFGRLDPEERTVLQCGAVIGRTFWDRAVDFLEQHQASRNTTPEALDALRRREMVFRRERSTFEATQEFRFKHALLRDVTYQSLLKRQRQKYHRRAAEWLQAVAGQGRRLDEYAAPIAGHYEEAGDAEQASEWYGRAGRVAAGRYANGEALHAFEKALSLTPEQHEARHFEILLAREKVYNLLGNQEARLQDLQALERLARSSADPYMQARVALRQADYHVAISEFAAAVSLAQKAIFLAQQAQDAVELIAEGHMLQVTALIRQGAFEPAREHAERGLQLARENDWPALQANSLRGLGMINYYLGSAREARDYFEEARALFEQIGDRQGEAHALNNVGGATFNLGDYAGAEHCYSRSLQLCRMIGDRVGEGRALNNLGIVSVSGGKYDQAEAYYLQGLEICRQAGHRSFEASALDNLGNLALYRYQYARAQHYYEESARAARAINDTVAGSITELNLGRAYLAVGDYEAAYAHLQESLVLNQGAHHGDCHARLGLSQYYVEQGEADRAHGEAQKALEEAQTFHLRSEEAAAFHQRAEALLAGNDPGAASDDFRSALSIRHELGEFTEELESKAGLAGVALSLGQFQEARALVEEILSALEVRGTLGFLQPAHVFLICYRVLSACQDRRAAAVLDQGYDLLQTCAASLQSDAQRQTFLEKVPAHRELLAAWLEKQ